MMLTVVQWSSWIKQGCLCSYVVIFLSRACCKVFILATMLHRGGGETCFSWCERWVIFQGYSLILVALLQCSKVSGSVCITRQEFNLSGICFSCISITPTNLLHNSYLMIKDSEVCTILRTYLVSFCNDIMALLWLRTSRNAHSTAATDTTMTAIAAMTPIVTWSVVLLEDGESV